MNEEGIEKKKVIYGHTKIHKSGRIFEARSRTFTFAPYETKTIEWTLHANIPGGENYTPVQEQIVSVEGQLSSIIEVTEAPKETPTPMPKPLGFEAIFAISGLSTIAYLLRRRK